MKRVYYPQGTASVIAGAAGQLFVGKAKPVSDAMAEKLLKRPGFYEAGPDIPNMDGYDQLLAEAEEADKADAAAAKADAAAKAKTEKKAPKGVEEAAQ